MSDTQTLTVHSPDELDQFTLQLAASLQPFDMISLDGDLGAGKTRFVQGLGVGMGIEGDIVSPTYTIVNEYPGPVPLIHFDWYRIRSELELYTIGWEDYVNRAAVICVEWSDRFPSLLPPESIRVRFRVDTPTQRTLSINDGRKKR